MRKLTTLGAGLAALSIAFTSAAAASAAASSAQAAVPSQFRLSFPLTGTDATTCGFPIAFDLQVTLVGRVYVDSLGNPVRGNRSTERRGNRQREWRRSPGERPLG